MISKISIKNFKSLKDIQINCGNLNLLTGLNGMGKSSIIQSLLLLKQSSDKGYLAKEGLTLKGDLTNIGTGKDALCQFADDEEIEFSLNFINDPIVYKGIFQYKHDSDFLPYIDDLVGDDNEIEGLQGLNRTFDSNFKYLNADRWVRNQYERSDFQVVRNRNLGKNGEFASHYLANFGDDLVNENLLFPTLKDDKTLLSQVSAWMGEISPGIKIIAEKIPGVDAVRLGYEFKSSSGSTNEYTPTNVGFGVTYVLPIIVYLLSCRPGDIVIIENPESHLHPQGQSSIGRLIGFAANFGVQIFVESHSDHILNGICIAIKQKKLDSSLAKIYFVHKDDQILSTCHEVGVNEEGRIDDGNLRQLGIIGFFDQINIDMKTILF